MRAQLMEFTAPRRYFVLNARSPARALTMSWASSNTPRTAMFAHAAMRRQHEDGHALLAAQRVLGRRARVAGRGAHDVQRGAALGQHIFEDLAQELHGHVLEGQRRPFGQAQQRQAAVQRTQRDDVFAVEDLLRVGRASQAPQVVRRDVGGEQRQHFEGEVRLGQAAPGFERLLGHLGQLLRHGQPAVGRQAFQQDVGEPLGVHAAASRDVFHVKTRCARWLG
ncbi:hypothetical protein G6F57_018863 [Rhizopus arrhizus]|nr:hypothetical protein G6F57_018863 [Rhizopus arrhizus]